MHCNRTSGQRHLIMYCYCWAVIILILREIVSQTHPLQSHIGAADVTPMACLAAYQPPLTWYELGPGKWPQFLCTKAVGVSPLFTVVLTAATRGCAGFLVLIIAVYAIVPFRVFPCMWLSSNAWLQPTLTVPVWHSVKTQILTFYKVSHISQEHVSTSNMKADVAPVLTPHMQWKSRWTGFWVSQVPFAVTEERPYPRSHAINCSN